MAYEVIVVVVVVVVVAIVEVIVVVVVLGSLCPFFRSFVYLFRRSRWILLRMGRMEIGGGRGSEEKLRDNER